MNDLTLKDLECLALEELYARTSFDQRIGLKKLIERREREVKAARNLEQLFQKMNEREQQLSNSYQAIAGLDEVGRGPLAGPVVVACVILDPDQPILGLRDSKRLSAERRRDLSLQIREKARCYSISGLDEQVIDDINILEATKRAMVEAIQSMRLRPDYLLIDALRLPVDIPQEGIIRGDDTCNAIAAASILAKVYRDELMEAYDLKFPGYGFASNKGYGCESHIEAIRKLGPCPIHRKSFLKNITTME